MRNHGKYLEKTETMSDMLETHAVKIFNATTRLLLNQCHPASQRCCVPPIAFNAMVSVLVSCAVHAKILKGTSRKCQPDEPKLK